MVKVSKIFLSLKYSFFLIIALLIPLHAIAKENISNNTPNDPINNGYKILQKKINLMPLPTFAVLGLNTYLVNKGESSYLVTIRVNVKKHNWLIDTVKIRRELIINQDDDFIQNIPINLYLSEDIEIEVNVKQISKLSNKENKVNLPYFIVVNNKLNNKIYLLKEGNVNINLDNKKAIILNDNIKIKFNQKQIDNLEILVGFKQTTKDFSNLQNYVSNDLVSKYKKEKTIH